MEEPAADLAMSVAIASSLRDMPVKADMVLIGEIGLSGELRWVSQMIPRLREAAKLGFKSAVIPQRTSHAEALPDGIQVMEARSLQEALRLSLIDPDLLIRKENNHESLLSKIRKHHAIEHASLSIIQSKNPSLHLAGYSDTHGFLDGGRC